MNMAKSTIVTMEELIEAGVHFGHQTSRWNPKMKRFILTKKNGIYILDLEQTVELINQNYEIVRNTVANGGIVLFVGTKKQAGGIIKKYAQSVDMPYINERWIGGLLTNYKTISARIERLKELDKIDFEDSSKKKMTKKEMLMLKREKDKLENSLGGIVNMNQSPALLWVVDTNKEYLAVSEAKKLQIGIMGILDSNCSPDDVDFPIPGNDDAIKSITILTSIIAKAVEDGTKMRLGRLAKLEPNSGESNTEKKADEPVQELESATPETSESAPELASAAPSVDSVVKEQEAPQSQQAAKA
jgi:small subunit ribosomal protein S2